MEVIEIDGVKYIVKQTDLPNKKWVQTDNGKRIAIRPVAGAAWKWKVMKK